MGCMRIEAVTPLYPALITPQANLSEKKKVLISPTPGPVQPQFRVFEISSPDDDAERWLETTHYAVEKCILAVPFFSPDGEVIMKSLICESTVRSMGRVLWNQNERCLKLVFPRAYFPALTAYFCIVERFHNPIKQPNLEFSMDCMRMLVVTPLYPALIMRQVDLSKHKLVLISPVPDPVQQQIIVFEISSPDNDAITWLELTHYDVKIRALSVPFFSPDGEVIQEGLICVSTARPMGRVLWNQNDRRCQKLVFPRPYLTAYFCMVERFDNPIKQPNLPDTDIYTAPSSETAFSSSRTPEPWVNMVEDEVLPHHVEMPEPQAIKVDDDFPNILCPATPEYDLAHLLPADPFDIVGFT